jgi:SAM-dependent methyltransferase
MRYPGLFFIFAALLFAQPDPAVQDFMKWYPTYKDAWQPPVILKAYTAKLAADGLSPTDVEVRLSAVRKAMAAMPRDLASLHFDRLYSLDSPPFRLTASAFLVRMVDDRKPGRALDVAMGQGRHALYLASKGWEVTGYDISPVGLATARAASEKAGFKLNTVLASHDEFDYGAGKWDLIVETFAFTNLADEAYRQRIFNSLKPGGLLVIEGFGNPNPSAPRNVMLKDFGQYRVVAYEDRDDVSDWGLQKMRLTRLALEK